MHFRSSTPYQIPTGTKAFRQNDQLMTDKDKLLMNDARSLRRSQKDILGPHCEVGFKLRALYASIQDETIPDRFLDLLEKLDQVEQESMRGQSSRSAG